MYVSLSPCTLEEHDPIEVYVKPDVSKGVRSLLKEYTKMILVVKKVNLPDEKFDSLKSFLAEYCDEDSFEDCSTINVLVKELKTKLKISIFNIHTLMECCEYFSGNSQAVAAIQQYEGKLETFLESTSVGEFECSLHSIRPDVEEITLKLDDTTSRDTLRNLKNLANLFFGETHSKAHILHKIHRGCVCVTWFVRMSLVPILKAIARQLSPEYLASKGVLELVIGLRIAPNEGLLLCCPSVYNEILLSIVILTGHHTTAVEVSNSEISVTKGKAKMTLGQWCILSSNNTLV